MLGGTGPVKPEIVEQLACTPRVLFLLRDTYALCISVNADRLGVHLVLLLTNNHTVHYEITPTRNSLELTRAWTD